MRCHKQSLATLKVLASTVLHCSPLAFLYMQCMCLVHTCVDCCVLHSVFQFQLALQVFKDCLCPSNSWTDAYVYNRVLASCIQISQGALIAIYFSFHGCTIVWYNNCGFEYVHHQLASIAVTQLTLGTSSTASIVSFTYVIHISTLCLWQLQSLFLCQQCSIMFVPVSPQSLHYHILCGLCLLVVPLVSILLSYSLVLVSLPVHR